MNRRRTGKGLDYNARAVLDLLGNSSLYQIRENILLEGNKILPNIGHTYRSKSK